MHLNLKNNEAHRLAAELARHTGENMTQAVLKALRERLDRLEHDRTGASRLAAIRAIQARVARALARSGLNAPSQAELDLADHDERGLSK
ncbi:MAG: type II toxin-antitoxin system VapB family antitoxin [Caulobacteraceae bacterium]